MGKYVFLGVAHEEGLPCTSEDGYVKRWLIVGWQMAWFHVSVTEGHGFTPLFC